MTKAKWTKTIEITSTIPIDITLPKVYVLADTPYNAKYWQRVFRTDDGIVVARLEQGDILSRNVELTIEAKSKISEESEAEVIDIIRYECGLDEEMTSVRRERQQDILADIAAKTNPGFRLYASSNVYEVALFAIFYQNMEFVGYQHLKERFMAEFGEPVSWNKRLRLFPTREKLAEISRDEWHKFGLGYKSDYLGAMTTQDWKNIEIYAYYPVYERGLAGLEQIQGIGPYTSRLIMIYAMRRYEKAFYDAFVQEVLDHKYGLSRKMPLSEYDAWMKRKWPKDTALILHMHLQEYFPKFMKTLDLEEIKNQYYA